MREIVNIQGIDNWSNGWLCSTDFQRINSKFKNKCKDVNKDNNLNRFTFSVLFVIYKRCEVEIIHELSWYDKEQLPYLKSTQPFFFGDFHIQQFNGTYMTSKFNEHNIRFPIYGEGNIDIKQVNMTRTINQKSPPSSMNKREDSDLV